MDTKEDVVSFVNMADGTAQDYALVARYDQAREVGLAHRVLALLDAMKGDTGGYQVDRYTHSLQSATRAFRDGADEETVVCALLHDIGDHFAPRNHSQFAAAVLRPYISEKNYWIIANHGLFQGYYYFHHYGGDRHARDQFRDHPHFQACVDFCEHWDQNCFDPRYENLPLEHFAPMVQRILERPPEQFV